MYFPMCWRDNLGDAQQHNTKATYWFPQCMTSWAHSWEHATYLAFLSASSAGACRKTSATTGSFPFGCLLRKMPTVHQSLLSANNDFNGIIVCTFRNQWFKIVIIRNWFPWCYALEHCCQLTHKFGTLNRQIVMMRCDTWKHLLDMAWNISQSVDCVYGSILCR